MNTRFLYRLYGLVVASDLSLPELIAVENELPDISIRFAKVPQQGLVDGRQLGPFHYAAPGKLWLYIPKIARFMVLGGNEILIDPLSGVDEDSLRVFLLGSCIGALLMQRNFLVLRGCAIRFGNHSLLCLGDSAAGKSTLAAALMRRGHSLLSDDIVAIDRENHAIPGFPHIKLWRNVVDMMEISTAPLRRVRANIEKYQLPLNEHFHPTRLPIRWIYILQTHARPEFSLESISGIERFTVLHNNCYRPSYLDGMNLTAGQLQPCANLAGKIQIKSLHRPLHPLRVDELVDFMLEDIGSFD